MIHFSYYLTLFALMLLVLGLSYLSDEQLFKQKFFGKFLGITFISVGSFFFGCLSLGSLGGAPIKINRIKSFYEIRLEKRINQSLSLVKTIDGNDERVVKGIPIEVREGDVFMIKKDDSVVIIKSPPNQH